jgi:tRNA pseudouridine38-40 synthase
MNNMNRSPISKRFLIKLWYIGTQFRGSQRQPNGRTVEGELIRVLVTRGYIQDEQTNRFRAAVRTDAGVHARCALFSFDSSKEFFIGEVNHYLPDDMGVWAWTECPPDFHPRFDALGKEYRYFHYNYENLHLNMEKIRTGLAHLLGNHDFRLFSKKDLSKSDQSTELTLAKAEFVEVPFGLIFIYQSTHFLWQQIRRMTQFILELGQGLQTIEELDRKFSPEAIANNREQKDGPADSGGLILWDILLPAEIQFTVDEKSLKFMNDVIKKRSTALALEAFTLKYFNENEII